MTEAAIEAEIQAKGLNAPRITPDDIDRQIASECYIRPGAGDMNICPMDAIPAHERALSCLTICVLVLRNGYTVIGTSACASPENYDAELGRKIARQNARQQIWALEGYRLRSELAAP
jgi:hypothetical protein